MCGGGPDTTEHRALHCKFYVRPRLRFLDVVRQWHALPSCMTVHGLCPANPVQIDFWKQLALLPWDHGQWFGKPVHDGIQMLFVDGSCSDSGRPERSLAGWSVVSADVGGPVASGLQPSCVHSSNRSELWAFTMAVQWLIDHGCSGRIHSDSQYVLDGYSFLAEALKVPSDWSDRDLWDQLLQRLMVLPGILEVKKVRAHLPLGDSRETQSDFETYWNAVADTNAKGARISARPAPLAEVFQRLASIHSWQVFWTKRCQEFLLALALHDVQTCEAYSRPEQLEPEDEFICVLQDAVPNPRIFMDHFPLDLFPALARCPAIVAFGLDLVFVFSKWLLALDRVSPLMKPVSFVEIFIGFYLDCGVEMPVAGRDARSNRVWHSVSSGAATDLMGRTLGSKVEVFRVLFQLVLDAFTPIEVTH